MSEPPEKDDRRKRSRSRSRDRDRHSERSSDHKKHSRDRKPRSRSRSRSRSPDSRKHSRHRHRDDDRDRHSSHKKHKRHGHDRDSRSHKHSSHRGRSRSPSVSSTFSASIDTGRPGIDSTLSPPAFPSAASLHTARSILASLLALDPASHDDLLFLLFQLDHHHSIILQHIRHPQARHSLQQLVHVLGLQRTTEEGGEEGWRVWDEWGERRLLPELESVFEVGKKGEKKRAADVEETKAESGVSTADLHATVHPAAVIGPALPPPSYRPPSTIEQQEPPQRTADTQDEQDDEDEDGADYGPRLASKLTADEIAALDQLQRARQHLNDTKDHIQHLRSTATTDFAAAPTSHEEWMTVVPAAMSGQAALMAAMTGDRAMKGRGFAMRDGGSGGERDSGWTAGPQEREWRRMEREAEKSVEKALAHLRAVQQRLHNKPTAPSSYDAPLVRTAAVVSSASSAEPSLLELHQQRVKAEQSKVHTASRLNPIMWDREKEMGMRRHKTDTQIASEMRGAADLSSRFAVSG